MKYCFVAVNYPREPSVLTYLNVNDLDLKVGDIVQVPLGRREEVGCVVDFKNEITTDYKLREVIKVESEYFKLSPQELSLYKWMSEYYMYPLGKVIFDCLPKHLKRIKDPSFSQIAGEKDSFIYNSDQKKIIEEINSKEGFGQSLIHGITGSGKSLVFLELIRKKIKEGFSVHYLLPEINLTPQFVNFFSEFLGCKIYTYTSAVTGSEKFNLWRVVKDLKEPCLFIGVRSSVFLPVKNLGLIIIDEEHDRSLKQEDRCRYHARDVSIKKAQMLNIPIVMASATPSLETYYRFKENENLGYFTLKNRFNDSKLPEIKIVDNENLESDHWPLNAEVIERMEKSLSNGYQSIIFVNKLGFSRYIQCQNCSHTFDCPNCDIRLTQFKSRKTLECYSCEYKDQLPNSCPDCGCLDLFQGGFGTERIDEAIKKLFPDKKIARFDRDQLKKITDIEQRLKDFNDKKIDILIGTQMLSKGHNFKNVDTLVILGVDNNLHRPDFRAQEEIYQQVVQVSGRAGRFGEEALVYIQSDLRPKVFNYIQEKTFDDFYQDELKIREVLSFPPFSKLIKVEASSKNEDYLYQYLLRLKNDLQKKDIQVLGPIPELMKKRSNRYYYYLLGKDVRLRLKSNDKMIDLKIHVNP